MILPNWHNCDAVSSATSDMGSIPMIGMCKCGNLIDRNMLASKNPTV